MLRQGRAYEAKLAGNSVVHSIYGADRTSERHRYKVNIRKVALEAGEVLFSDMSPDGALPETVEQQDHPWFVGVQFHPELKSKPFNPHPLRASSRWLSISAGLALVGSKRQKTSAVGLIKFPSALAAASELG